jgi:predicted ATPase/DNA-binding winged helix-turn-helix (wHTH) protein/Tol biopolymer transport system component
MSLDLTSDLLQFNFTMPNGSKNGIYSFDRFRLDADKLMLYRDGTEVTLAPKIVKTLAVLIENRGSILSKDELIDKVWDDSIVEESNLSQNLYILRKTLGTKPDGGQYIETLRRRGYRFNAEVECRSRNGTTVPKNAGSFVGPLIGREKEIEEVANLLSRSDVSLVTVSGVGGVGKTTFARAVAEKLEGEREVFFVELAAITRAELVASAVGNALGVKQSGDESLVGLIKENLQNRSVLLVLDNFEQVAAAAPMVAELAAPDNHGLKILVTSRVSLRVQAEKTYVLPPLQIPAADGGDLAPEDLSDCEAVNLFVERAKQGRQNFELTRQNAADVASICTQLGGLPLAIELAAARIRFMSPEAVLKRLRKQLDFLQGAKRDAPQRQRTMRETIAWSYDLLTAVEQQVFARLGVFSGGFDISAAEFVCADPDMTPNVAVLDVITSLLEHNLLSARPAANGEPRIQMLEVVREYAEEVLAEQGDEVRTKAAHAAFFLQLGEEAEPQLLAARSAEWLDRLETEHDNVRAALAWSAEVDHRVGQRLSGAIWRFWWLHGHIREACRQLDTFLALPCSDPKTRAKMLVGATFLNRLAGNSERSRVYAEEGVELASANGDLRVAALSLNQLGFLSLDVGDFAAAERMFQRGLKRAEELGDIQILALLNNGLGELSRSKGDYGQAADFYGRALEYNRKAGDRVRQTTCLINLGATALMQGDRESGGEFYRSGLEISSEMEDMNGTLYCLEGIAGSYWALNDPARASLIFGAAHAGRQKNNLLLEPADQIPYEQSIKVVRESLGNDAFDDHFSRGTATGLKAAIELALDHARNETRPAASSPKTKSESITVEPVVVQREGNVLRLVDWSSAKENRATETEIATTPDKDETRSRARSTRLKWALAAAVVTAAGVAIVSGYRSWFATSRASERKDLSIIRLTNTNFVRDAVISPDGNFFVYNEDLGDSSRVWLQQTGTSTRKEIIPGGKFQICCKTFTPDGKYVYFSAQNEPAKRNDLYRIATLGGTPEKILDGVNGHVGFSPAGDQMLFLRHSPERKGSSYFIAAIDGKGGEREILNSNDQFALLYPAWAPDGKKIAFASVPRDPNAKGSGSLSTLDLESGAITPISAERWGTCYRLEWLKDGSAIAMVGTREGETNTAKRDQVYLISYPGGQSRRLTMDGNRHEPESLAVTNDGTVFAVSYNRSSQIWALDASGDAHTAIQLTTGSADGRGSIAPLPDGRIGYTARSGDELNVWVMNADGTNQIQVGDASAVQDLTVTPDGAHFIYADERGGNTALYRVGVDGSSPIEITAKEEFVIDSTVSPDGAWVVYDVWRTNGVDHDVQLKKIPLSGGEEVMLTDDDCSIPLFSRDGAYISCVYFNGSRVAVRSAADGTKIAVFDTVKTPLLNSGAHWTPDGKALVYIVHQKNICNLWKQPIDGGKPEQLTNFTNGACYSLEYSWDGSRLYVARGEEIRDAILIKDYK